MNSHPHQPPPQPAPDAAWARADSTRAMVAAGIVTLLSGGLAAVFINSAQNDELGTTTAAEILGIGASTLCVLVTVALMAAMVVLPLRAKKMPCVAFDGSGVWWVLRQQATLVPWQQIGATGIGYMTPPTAVGQVGPRERFAFEVFPLDPYLPDRPHAAVLRHWDRDEAPPRQGLPSRRLRFAMSVGLPRTQIQRAVQQYAPHTWLGEYERQWHHRSTPADR